MGSYGEHTERQKPTKMSVHGRKREHRPPPQHEEFKVNMWGARLSMRGVGVCQSPARNFGLGVLIGGGLALLATWAVCHYGSDSSKYSKRGFRSLRAYM